MAAITWLLENKNAINAKIRRGINQLDSNLRYVKEHASLEMAERVESVIRAK